MKEVTTGATVTIPFDEFVEFYEEFVDYKRMALNAKKFIESDKDTKKKYQEWCAGKKKPERKMYENAEQYKERTGWDL